MSEELLLPLGWVVSGGFRRTLVICLLICPVIPQLLGVVFVSYWAPWSPRYQFLAYIPGNPLLALFIAGASTTFGDAGPHVPSGWNEAALCGAFTAYVALNVLDLGANYTTGQMKSANKVYHNALYFWYGYLAVACFIALLEGRKRCHEAVDHSPGRDLGGLPGSRQPREQGDAAASLPVRACRQPADLEERLAGSSSYCRRLPPCPFRLTEAASVLAV